MEATLLERIQGLAGRIAAVQHRREFDDFLEEIALLRGEFICGYLEYPAGRRQNLDNLITATKQLLGDMMDVFHARELRAIMNEKSHESRGR
jgi:hypothetical protein